jgi:hypothetical protein
MLHAGSDHERTPFVAVQAALISYFYGLVKWDDVLLRNLTLRSRTALAASLLGAALVAWLVAVERM